MKLYIFCGLPYSGKSTLTKELLKRPNTFAVSMDDIMDERGLDSELMSQDEWNSVYSEGYEELKIFLKEGSDVVLDLGNLLKSERVDAELIGKSVGAECVKIYINTPVEEIWNRWKRNETIKERGQVSESELKNAIAMFETPTEDEDFIELKPTDNLVEWINKKL